MANGYTNPQSMATALRQQPTQGTVNAPPAGRSSACSGDLSQMTDEELDECLAGLYEDYEGMEEAADEDMEMAEDWMDTETPKGRKYGKIYTAADPLEHLGATGQRMLGQYARGKAQTAREDVGSMRAEALRNQGRNYLRGLYR